MAARAIWKAILKIGAERIPLKLYSAVEDRTVHFNVLEKSTMTRITQHMVNPKTGEEVPNDQIQKAYEVPPSEFSFKEKVSLPKLRREAPRADSNSLINNERGARTLSERYREAVLL
jgi:DNA end-binding protein Ku